MTSNDERLERLEILVHEQEIWSAAHDAKIDEKWRQQEAFNSHCRTEVDGIQSRLATLERRLIVLCTLASAAGGVASRLLPF